VISYLKVLLFKKKKKEGNRSGNLNHYLTKRRKSGGIEIQIIQINWQLATSNSLKRKSRFRGVESIWESACFSS
jgi:hypothetical protein